MSPFRYRFERVSVVIGDPKPEMRQAIQAALLEQGFRRILVTDRMSQVRDVVETDAVDLLICTHEISDEDFCALIKCIRHQEIGINPFVLIITLVLEPKGWLIKKVIDSGTDDLLAEPFSLEQIVEKVTNLAEHRKPFFVAHNYIGPSRRLQDRTGDSKDGEIEVPNVLRAQAIDGLSITDIVPEIERTARLINERKIECDARHAANLVESVLTLIKERTDVEKISSQLDILLSTCLEIMRRLPDSPYGEIESTCKEIGQIVTRLRIKPTPFNTEDVEDLPTLAKAMVRAFPG